MSTGKIGLLELTILSTLTIVGTVFLQLPQFMARMAQQSGWVAILAATLPAGGLAYVICWLARRFPDQTPVEYLQTIFGKFLGKILAIGLALVYLAISSFLVRDFAVTLLIGTQPQVPVSLTMIVFLALQVFQVYWGLEVLSRVAVVFLPYIFISPILITAGNLPNMHLGRLLPVLGAGLPRMVPAVSLSSVYFGEILLMASVLPHVRATKNRVQALLASIALAASPLTAVTAASVAVFGAKATARMVLPAAELARVVTFGEALQRLESVFVLFWMFAAIIKVGLFMWVLCDTVARSLNLRGYRALTPSIGGLMFVCGMLTQHFWDQIIYFNILRRVLPMVFYGFPTLVALAALILRKGGSAGNGRQEQRQQQRPQTQS